MDASAGGRLTLPSRARARHGVALAVLLAVIATLLGVLGPRSADAPAQAQVDRPGLILGFDDASAAERGRTQYLRLTSKVLGGPLVPGMKRPLQVTVKNPYPYSVRVSSITAKVRSTTVAGCKSQWFKATVFQTRTKGRMLLIKGHKTSKKTLGITFVNLPTVNQNACKLARYKIALTAKARRA